MVLLNTVLAEDPGILGKQKRRRNPPNLILRVLQGEVASHTRDQGTPSISLPAGPAAVCHPEPPAVSSGSRLELASLKLTGRPSRLTRLPVFLLSSKIIRAFAYIGTSIPFKIFTHIILLEPSGEVEPESLALPRKKWCPRG